MTRNILVIIVHQIWRPGEILRNFWVDIFLFLLFSQASRQENQQRDKRKGPYHVLPGTKKKKVLILQIWLCDRTLFQRPFKKELHGPAVPAHIHTACLWWSIVFDDDFLFWFIGESYDGFRVQSLRFGGGGAAIRSRLYWHFYQSQRILVFPKVS